MKTRCPCCGATLSLDALVAHEDARRALAFLFAVSGDLGAAICRYLALFRPAQRDLSMDRVARLLETLSADIKSERITRNGEAHFAPPEAFVWAIRQVMDARDAGKLKTPLNGHGYLYEVITSWRPEHSILSPGIAKALDATGERLSRTAAAIEVLRGRA